MPILNVKIIDGAEVLYDGQAFVRMTDGRWTGFLQNAAPRLTKTGRFTIDAEGRIGEVEVHADNAGGTPITLYGFGLPR